MWSYYGRKSKVVQYYPAPYFDTIVEPFAGTATYSLYKNNWKRDVILCDKYKVITEIWKYLQQATKEQVLQLPELEKGEKVEDYEQLTDPEKWLIGYNINRGQIYPAKTANNWNKWPKQKVKIANSLHKIRHWKIVHGDYRDLENIKATWYIDPPYQEKGYKYKHSDIDFKFLGEWCKDREGQVIVCENLGAGWLPFERLCDQRGTRKKSTEAIYHQGPGKQMKIGF